MELEDDMLDEDVNQEEDFHFKISNMDDEDDMVDLSSDEGETEEFIKDYNISAEDDVFSISIIIIIGRFENVLCP